MIRADTDARVQRAIRISIYFKMAPPKPVFDVTFAHAADCPTAQVDAAMCRCHPDIYLTPRA